MEGCDDDETDFPLTYRFYTVDVDNSDKVTYLTAESQLASEISTKLSAGKYFPLLLILILFIQYTISL